MPDPKQLPFLLKLVDDESSVVSSVVLKELKTFGFTLKKELSQLHPRPNASQRRILKNILEEQSRNWLKSVWKEWFYLHSEEEKLEKALSFLSEFQNGLDEFDQLTPLLDQLADAYRSAYTTADVYQLNQFLFKKLKFQGAISDYYNPQNSNLVSVIKRKRGVPISLTCIYMLLAHRLGLEVEGCNFPGHFLGRVKIDEKILLVDCFNGGRFLNEKDVLKFGSYSPAEISRIIKEEVLAETIVSRVLNNLLRSYRQTENLENNLLMSELLALIKNKTQMAMPMKRREMYSLVVPGDPRYKPGKIIVHKKLKYRGIVVDFDFSYHANQENFEYEQFKPNPCQPWYYILVHDSDQVMYAAESNLIADHSQEAVVHPLISYFFKSENGLYTRNNQPWVG